MGFMRVQVLLLVLVLSSISFAANGPQAFLTEFVLADYNWDGSLKATPQRYGFVEVLVPNPADVLQYVRLNLSSTENTALSSNVSYNSVAYSPSNERTRMYVDTSVLQDTQYNITNFDVAPAINVSMGYTNYEGGVDAYSSGNVRPRSYDGGPTQTNRLNFTFVFKNPSAGRDLNNTLFNITFNASGADRVSITTSPTAPSGTVSRVDADSDSSFETVIWSGNFTRGITVTISFDANVTEGVNYAAGTDDINLNGITPSIGVWATWSNTTLSSLSGTQGSYLSTAYFSRLFARGPSRAGIDMALEPYEDQTWRVRGFFENMANSTYGLNYTVSSWALYSINASSGAPYPSANYSSSSDPSWANLTQSPSSTRFYTKWFDSGLNATKPYFASSFEWEVNWDSSTPKTYYSQINSTLDLRTLYQIDLSTSKSLAGIILPLTENNSVTVTDQTRHIGSSNISAYFININSIVPRQSLQGTTRLWRVNVSSINVSLYNGSYFELKQDGSVVNVSVRNPTASEDGLVNLTISNLTAANFTGNIPVGHYLRSSIDERIQLKFDVLSPDDIVTGEDFNFTGNSSMATLSGTPIMEIVPSQSITASRKRLVGYKDMIARDPNNPTWVNVSIRLDVLDKVGTGIAGIKFMDYIPNGTTWNPIAMNASINFSFFNGSAWFNWSYGVNYNITDMGWTTLADGSVVHAYEFVNISGSGWTLFDNQSILIQYTMNITQPGVYRLPVIIAAFDPDTGSSIGTSSIGVTKVHIPPRLLPPVISEGGLLPAKSVVVGKPASWIKQMEVYNPNSLPLHASFSTEVFMDSMNAVVEYTTPEGQKREESAKYTTSGGKRYLEWETTLAPLESRSYSIRILTPPVIEVERRIAELSQISEKLVKVSLEVSLKNLAEEDYKNVKLFMPVDDERIFSAQDDSFVPLEHSSAGNGSSFLLIPDVLAKQAFSVLLQYRESYPVVVITTDKENYEAGNPVGLSVLVINGGESVDHPYVETEIYSPQLDLMYSAVQGSKPLSPVERSELRDIFLIPNAAPTGNYLVSARFREDFATITQGSGKFYVLGSSGPDFMLLGYLLILVFTLLILYSSLKRVREIRESKSAKPVSF